MCERRDTEIGKSENGFVKKEFVNDRCFRFSFFYFSWVTQENENETHRRTPHTMFIEVVDKGKMVFNIPFGTFGGKTSWLLWNDEDTLIMVYSHSHNKRFRALFSIQSCDLGIHGGIGPILHFHSKSSATPSISRILGYDLESTMFETNDTNIVKKSDGDGNNNEWDVHVEIGLRDVSSELFNITHDFTIRFRAKTAAEEEEEERAKPVTIVYFS